jgi:D-proline reductase (dithiol) PrdB
MKSLKRIKNQAISRLISYSVYLKKKFIEGIEITETQGIPWTPLKKPMAACKVALVTTAGIHHRDQSPYDMMDKDGDSTFRVINVTRPINSLMITHDYYNHSDADKDINIVFPIERLKELEAEGVVGETAQTHYGFMGHIKGRHVQTLIKQSAPEITVRLKKDAVDVVLLTPG